jgi:hypothetical protein
MASGGGTLPAHARQVMYAARDAIQQASGRPLNDEYFTQTLLPDYMFEHPEETADWDVVFDARGHLTEPHTGYTFGIGTLQVRDYLKEAEAEVTEKIHVPEQSLRYPTCGPKNRYSTVLYIEKEGFLPLIERARFASRFDLAIMSSKGMGTTAARTLIERLAPQARILCLHDFDRSGLSILGTLVRNTRRYTYQNTPQVLDLGLRLTDVRELRLTTEEQIHASDPEDNLRLNGASEDEIAFLRGERLPGKTNHYRGQRVELNALTSDQFVAWLETKLRHHQVRKVIPDTATLEEAYRRTIALHTLDQRMRATLPQAEQAARTAAIPADLRARIERKLAETPQAAWDDVLREITAGHIP